MPKLVDLQTWFGTLISEPPHRNIGREGERYTTPPQRLEIYHRQYWSRLLKCLQENYPTLTRLYGYENFNQKIAIPYLTQYRPSHWALCKLGCSLPLWLTGRDQEIASLDAAANEAFTSRQNPPFDFNQVEALSKKLTLQPHVQIFKLNEDLFSFREEVLNHEVPHWQEHKPPTIRQGGCFFTLYRNIHNQVNWKEVTIGEYRLLHLFKKGISIQEACAQIEEEGGEICEEAEARLPLWFREWTFLKLFQEY